MRVLVCGWVFVVDVNLLEGDISISAAYSETNNNNIGSWVANIPTTRTVTSAATNGTEDGLRFAHVCDFWFDFCGRNLD